MAAHLQEAAVVGALLADEDRVDRRLHIVVDAARAGALEEGEGAVVGVEHHLLRLARVPRRPACAFSPPYEFVVILDSRTSAARATHGRCAHKYLPRVRAQSCAANLGNRAQQLGAAGLGKEAAAPNVPLQNLHGSCKRC